MGTITQHSTHYFGAYFKGLLGGVVIFSIPNAFSKLIGDSTVSKERLLSRGACASWTPKGLASSMIMQCIRWMVKNTPYRLFTAYSDPTAKELGTIYQACNFYYLGQKSGTSARYINPYTGKLVSDRYFRQKTAYKKYAEELGLQWNKNYSWKNGMLWNNVPDDVETRLRQYARDKQRKAKRIELPNKHKYAYVLGRNRQETKELRRLFLSLNNVYDYPKIRGDETFTAALVGGLEVEKVRDVKIVKYETNKFFDVVKLQEEEPELFDELVKDYPVESNTVFQYHVKE